jgi:hypothetical protein
MREHAPGGAGEALLWLGLAAAFSPVLVSLVTSRAGPAAHSSALLVPLLLLRLVAADPTTGARRSWAPALVLLGAFLELLGVVGDAWTIARVGLPTAALGLALWTGRPRPAVAMLVFALVPPPVFLFEATTPHVESALGGLAVRLLDPLGAGLEIAGPLVRAGGASFELESSQNGLHLAIAFAVLGWYAGCLRRRRPLRLVAGALCGALVALPAQLLLVTTALALFAWRGSAAAAAWLDHGGWLVAAGAFVTWTELRARSRAQRPGSPPG